MFGCQALGAGSSWMGRRARAETTDVSPASATSAAVRTKESSPHLRSFSITILCEQAARVGYKCLLVVNIATAKSCNQSNWLTRLRQTMYFDLRLKNRSWLASTLKAKLGLSSDLHYVKFNGRSKIIVFSNFSASHLVRRWCPIELTGFKGCCWKSIHFFHVLLAKNKVSDFDKRDFECHVLDRHRICKMCETQSKEWNADLSKTFIELLKKLKPSREQRWNVFCRSTVTSFRFRWPRDVTRPIRQSGGSKERPTKIVIHNRVGIALALSTVAQMLLRTLWLVSGDTSIWMRYFVTVVMSQKVSVLLNVLEKITSDSK